MVSINIVCYLFLAGMGSSAFLIGFLIDFLMRIHPTPRMARMATITDAGLFAGPLAVLLSSVFLVADLGVPERFLLAFFSPSSILTWGAWGLSVFVLCSILALVLSPFATTLLGKLAESAFQFLAAVGAVFTLLYSAVFLSSYPSVPFLNTPAVPALFVVSASSTGLALLMVIAFLRRRVGFARGEVRALVHIEAVAIVLEVMALSGFVAVSVLSGAQTYEALAGMLFGRYSALFWAGAVLLGLVLPLAFDLANSRSVNAVFLCVGAICVLVGAFCLRYAVLASAIRYGMPFMLPAQFWL